MSKHFRLYSMKVLFQLKMSEIPITNFICFSEPSICFR